MVLGDKNIFSGLGAEVAAVAMDLQRMGVRWEVDEEPFNWLAPKEKAVAVKAAAPVREIERDVATPAQNDMPKGGFGAVTAVMGAMPASASLALAVKAPAAIVEEVVTDVRVWKGGEPGGVLVLVRAEAPLENGDLALLQAMLAAVGLDKEPLGWVGAMLPDDMFAKDMQGKIGAEVVAMEPRQVLVLGSAMLGSWIGKNRGVEGWAQGNHKLEGLPDGVRVGVTYGTGMLRQKPLFKRLAWKHLLAWVE